MNKKETIWYKALCDVTSVLASYGCHYFLDTGTLLGTIRDGKFIEWDNDIDLGVVDCDSQTQIIHSISEELYKKGYNITSTDDVINVADNSGYLDLGVKFYEHKEDHYEAVLGKTEGIKIFSSIDNYLSGIITYKNGYGSFKRKVMLSRIICLLKVIFPNCIKRKIREKANVISIPVIIPEELLRSFILYPLYDSHFLVPSLYEQYLELRYGASWKTPRKDYNFIKDDGSLKKDI